MAIMALTRKTLPSFARYITPTCKTQALQHEVKSPVVIFHSLNVPTISPCIYSTNCFQRHFRANNVLKPILSAYNLPALIRLPSFTLSSNCRRYYHARTGLTVQETVYLSYLHSLVNELKVINEEQLKNDQTFRTETEERMNAARHHFLISANDVVSKILEKQSEISELRNMSSDEKDKDMREMMQYEIETLEKETKQLEEELIDVLAGEEPADNNDIILEVSAGVGGQEAMLFCAEVFNMYCQYGLGKGWNVMLVDKDENELGGIRKGTIEISGFDVYRWFKYEAGVHRVQRVPKTEKGGRVHTSTVSVSVLPQPREIDVQIDKKDLKIETFRNSGPGGQSVNTTDSAVRITHLPTGTVAECKKERSQIKNREHAMKVLKMRLYQTQLEEEEGNRRATRKMQIGSRGRSEKIRTYNYQQDRVTDHRVKENYSNLPEFLASGEGHEDLITRLEKDFKYKVVESMVDQFELSLKNQDNKKL